MMVGSFSGIAYRTFLARQAPVAVVGLGLVFLVLWLTYRTRLPRTLEPVESEVRLPVHYPLMLKTGAVVAVMLVAFLAGVPIALVAIGGAAYTLLTRRVKPEKVYQEVNWQLLVLFTGLFVVIAGIEAVGFTATLLRWASMLGLERIAVLTVATAAISNLVSNVPAVLLLKSMVPQFAEPGRAWLVVAMASTFAGNLTIVGSVANPIVIEHARAARLGIGFVEYAKVGVPLTALTLLAGALILGALPAP